jgi:ribonuclease HII
LIFVGPLERYECQNEYRGRRTVKDVLDTLNEEQRTLFYKYIGEITSGYLSEETRKAYAKMAMTELNRDQFRVVAWLEMKALEEKGKNDE